MWGTFSLSLSLSPPPPSQVLLPLSGLTLKCSLRPLTFPVISNTGPDRVIGHLSAHGRPVYHFYFPVHQNSSRVIFQIVSIDNRIKQVHRTHSQSIHRSIEEADSPVHSRCCGSRNRMRCSTTDNYQ
jgi:hypothetical protein